MLHLSWSVSGLYLVSLSSGLTDVWLATTSTEGVLSRGCGLLAWGTRDGKNKKIKSRRRGWKGDTKISPLDLLPLLSTSI